MAIVIKRKDILHIQWFDPSTGKTNSRTTGLKDTATNRIKAKKIAKKLQSKLTEQYERNRQMGIRPTSISEAYKHFLNNNQGKDPKTIKDYERFYKKFTEFFDENAPCSTISKISVENWFNIIKKLPLAKNSIHAYGKQCIHFLNFLFEYSYVPMFKINKNVKTRPEVKEKIILKDEDIYRIFEELEGKNSNFKTLVYLLFYTGLRESDLLSLTVDKIDLKNREMDYFMKKGKTFRHVPFHEDLVPILESRMLEVKVGNLLSYTNVTNLGKAITRYFTKLEIKEKGYLPRTFRKTFITLCRNRFHIDASFVRELVGHSHGNVTDKYYNRIDIDTLKGELAKFKRPIKKEGL